MKLGIYTAIWGRPRLTKLVLDYYNRIDTVYTMSVVYSKEDPDPTHLPSVDWSDDMDLWSVVHPNSPLSDKWLRGMQECRDSGMDAVLIVGSDDLITPKYVEACRYLIENGADYVYLPGCYFYNALDGRMIWGQAERLGLGRCLSRRLLERLDWEPWPEGLPYGLDGAMWERVQALDDVSIVCLDEARKMGYVGLDIKTGSNLWDFDHIRDNIICFDTPAESVLREHFPSVADELLNWNGDD